FLQAQDGIRPLYVTGVQTSAPPISSDVSEVTACALAPADRQALQASRLPPLQPASERPWAAPADPCSRGLLRYVGDPSAGSAVRSEERRVGKGRGRGWAGGGEKYER